MKPTTLYRPVEAVWPLRGRDTQSPPTLIDRGGVTTAENIEFDHGTAVKRGGYTRLGGPLEGDILGLYEFETLAGVKHLLALTTKKQYSWNGSSWDNITYQETGTDVDWTGLEVNGLSVCEGYDTSGKWFYITNGVDCPRRWDGTGLFVLATPNISGFTTCRCLVVYKNRLFMGGVTTSGGGYEPQSLAWSQTGDFNEFVAIGADSTTLYELRGPIIRLEQLYGVLQAYSEDSIAAIAYVGGDVQFTFTTMCHNTRMVCGRGLVNLGDRHLFLSLETIFSWDGTTLVDVGGRIRPSIRADLDTTQADLVHAVLEGERRRVYITLPRVLDRVVYAFEIVGTELVHWIEQYAHSPSALAIYGRASGGQAWNATAIATTMWEDMVGVWGAIPARSPFPVRYLGSSSSVGQAATDYLQGTTPWNDAKVAGLDWQDVVGVWGAGTNLSQVYICENVLTDAASVITATLDTPDYEYNGLDTRFIEFEFEAKGTTVEVLYSTDNGTTWVSAGVTILADQWRLYRVYVDVVGRTIRYRFSNAVDTGILAVRRWRVWLNAEGAVQ